MNNTIDNIIKFSNKLDQVVFSYMNMVGLYIWNSVANIFGKKF